MHLFTDDEKILSKLTEKGNPLERLDAVMDWQLFLPLLSELFSRKNKVIGRGGRPHLRGRRDVEEGLGREGPVAEAPGDLRRPPRDGRGRPRPEGRPRRRPLEQRAAARGRTRSFGRGEGPRLRPPRRPDPPLLPLAPPLTERRR